MRVTGEIEIDAPRRKVWEQVSDPACYPSFMAGLTRWEVRSDETKGLGVRYLARWQIGSVPVGALLEVVEYEEPCELAWTSVSGIGYRGRFRLRDAADGTTRVSLRMSYQAPGGIAGYLADRVARPLVQRTVDETLATLKQSLDGSVKQRGRSLDPIELVPKGIEMVTKGVRSARVLAGTGILRPGPPDRMIGAAEALRRWGINPAAAPAVAAARYPDETAIIDDGGSVTFRQMEERTNALARGLKERHDAGPGTVIAVLCRNHRGFVEVFLAASKLGADLVFLNTGFSGPQVADVCQHEEVDLIIHDEDFTEVVEEANVPTVLAWHDDDRVSATIDELIESAATDPVTPPGTAGRVIILTSGTTGRPKGAPRSSPTNLDPAVAILSRIPYRARDTTVLAPPLFHAWGFANMTIALALSSTIVLRRRFDPPQALLDIEEHRARVLIAVPVMLQRILELGDEDKDSDASALEVVAVSGSALAPAVTTLFMDTFGDVLYNLYGSTEVAWATIADPAQLRAAPGTAGTPPPGTKVAILGDDGIELPLGQRGRIFVGNSMTFAGYTGGGGKTVIRGLVDTGDVGRFDIAGRLIVEGRGDDMIVSGGENVFPQEVEELLTAHPDIVDAAVIGVDDEEYGQRLTAFVVPRSGKKIDVADVKDHVRRHLARYKVPRDVKFLDELPRNQTGKVLKKDLPTQDSDGSDSAKSPKSSNSKAGSRR